MFRMARTPEACFDGYAVTVNGEAARLARARVSAMPYNTVWPGRQRPLDQTEEAAFLQIEADEPLHVEVRYASAPREVTVRPLSRGVKAAVDGCAARLTIEKPGAYTVEADGFHQALHLFVDSPRDFGVREGDENVLWFGPGVHRPGVVLLKSGQTVYIDRDAVVYGAFAALDCENVRVCGWGVIDGSWETRVTEDYLLLNDAERVLHRLDAAALMEKLRQKRVLWGGVRFLNCKNARMEGPIVRDTATFAVIPAGCDGVLIDDVKTIGMWRYNSDGIDIFNSSHVVIRGCFLRDFDDCIVIKGIVGWDARNNERISVEDSVIWCDWGRALEIGAETCAPEYRDIVFRNCDVIRGSTINLDIQHHNHALIHDILFADIRVEYTRYQLSDVYQHDMTAPYAPPAPARHPVPLGIYVIDSGLFNDVDYRNGRVKDIVFRDIQLLVDEGVPQPAPEFKGLDEAHDIRHVLIDNLTVNGRRMGSLEEAGVERNEFTEDISLR